MLIHNIYHKLKQRETIYCIIRIISRLSHRDKRFIHDVAMWDMNADQLTLEHGGKYNDGSIIYIIREQGNGYGFFAEFKSMLCELLFADSLGLKPTVYYGEEYAYYEDTTNGCIAFRSDCSPNEWNSWTKQFTDESGHTFYK